MAAYAAVARLERVDVRRASTWRAVEDRSPDPTPHATVEELAGRQFGEAALEWWASLREQVAMTTFYLFDPESWR
jgi:hypothetical protein